MNVGNTVVKREGTCFVGVVLSSYTLPGGGRRMDVMSVSPGAEGLIHIYRPDQFRPATKRELEKLEQMKQIWAGE